MRGAWSLEDSIREYAFPRTEEHNRERFWFSVWAFGLSCCWLACTAEWWNYFFTAYPGQSLVPTYTIHVRTYRGDFTALDWALRRETRTRIHTEHSGIRASKAWRSEKCWKLDIQFVQGRAIPVEILLSSRVAPLCIRCRGVARLDKSPDKTADNAESIVFTKGSPPPPPPRWLGVPLAWIYFTSDP